MKVYKTKMPIYITNTRESSRKSSHSFANRDGPPPSEKLISQISVCCAHVRAFPDLTLVIPRTFGKPTEVPEEVCSNGVPGVQRDEFCCEAQCGTCGGSGCGQRPGGQVRWCMVSYIFSLSCPLLRFNACYEKGNSSSTVFFAELFLIDGVG